MTGVSKRSTNASLSGARTRDLLSSFHKQQCDAALRLPSLGARECCPNQFPSADRIARPCHRGRSGPPLGWLRSARRYRARRRRASSNTSRRHTSRNRSRQKRRDRSKLRNRSSMEFASSSSLSDARSEKRLLSRQHDAWVGALPTS